MCSSDLIPSPTPITGAALTLLNGLNSAIVFGGLSREEALAKGFDVLLVVALVAFDALSGDQHAFLLRLDQEFLKAAADLA